MAEDSREYPAFPKCAQYTDLCEELRKLPATWYPHLIMVMIEAAYEHEVFVPGGASRAVRHTERRIRRSTRSGKSRKQQEVKP